MTNKNIDFIFEEEKIVKPKKSIFKKIIILVLGVFFLINIIFYIGNYNNYIVNTPEQLKNGRKDMLIALHFAVYETILIIVGLDIDNPILKPFKYLKELYYSIGIEKLPKDDADRVFWYQLVIYLPIYADYYNKILKIGDFTQIYGKEYSEKLLNDIYFNFELLAKYEFSDYKNKSLQDKFFWLYILMFEEYIYNFHLFNDGEFYSEKVFDEIKNKEKMEKLISVYKFSQNTFNNELYKEFSKYILEKEQYQLKFYETFFWLDVLIIAHNNIENKFNCNNNFNKELVNNFLYTEKKIIDLLQSKILSSSKRRQINILLNLKEIKKIIQPCIEK